MVLVLNTHNQINLLLTVWQFASYSHIKSDEFSSCEPNYKHFRTCNLDYLYFNGTEKTISKF